MIRKLNSRERIMLIVVGGIVGVFTLSLVVSGFRRSYTDLEAQLSTRREELKAMRGVLEERELWQQRKAWLDAHQPRLESRERSGVELLDSVRNTAKSHGVTLERPEIGTSESGPSYEAVSISLQTRSNWQSLIAMMNDLQQPGQFIVFEEANLRLDQNDPTQMLGRFRIAKWYGRGQ